MRISLIAAASDNDVIGRDGDLPWHLPDDFKHFKRVTLGHTLIVGRKTFAELGGPLPGRQFIVISRHAHQDSDRVRWVHSVSEALTAASAGDEVFIAGGGEIYGQTIGLAQRIHLTRVHAVLDGDTFFPVIDPQQWTLVSEEHHPADDRHAHPFTIQLWHRR